MSAWDKMNYQQRANARSVFETWELILFEKLKRGTLTAEFVQKVVNDIAMNCVPRDKAKQYLDEQIQDMKDQIAEQSLMGAGS